MAQTSANPHLFLSYATADRERALEVADALETAGIPVWIDRRGIPGGTEWAAQITQAVRSCRAVAVLCSATSIASRNVRQELQLAWDRDKPILPLLLEPVDFPDSVAYFLQGRQWIEVNDRADAEWVAEVAHALGQVVAEPSPAPVPASTSQMAKGNLPSPATPLVGRIDDVERVVALLGRDDVRLVTLTGPGGVGKTRLAIAVGEGLAPTFRDGAWFVRLAPIRDPDLVIPTIAKTLGIRDEGSLPQVDRLHSFLRNKHLLLVIDNVEHVIDAAPELAELLTHGSGVKMLATSRTVLHLSGENEFLVEPFLTPPQDSLVSVDEVESFSSVQLFAQRAAAAKLGFELTDQNAAAVAAICARLDGLPLAIEIAAARTKLLPPAALLSRLEKRLPLLTSGAGDLPARQQTLRGTIAWSYDLLSPDEQQVFRRLSVFVGGWTIKAAEAVAVQSVGDGVGGDLFEVLSRLVDQSLIRQGEGPDGEPRFGMLETIREFATEELATVGEVDTVAAAHLAHFVNLTEAVATSDSATDQRIWRTRLDVERDNIRAAFDWALAQADPRVSLQLAITMADFLRMRGELSEARYWLKRALAVSSESDARRAEALGWAATLAGFQGDLEAAR
jgi:predicted ATPase